MVATDCQPLSIVYDKGFKSLLKTLEPRYALPSSRYMTESAIPCIHDQMKSAVETKVLGIDSMIILTAHWLSDDFSAVLRVHTFSESHTMRGKHFYYHNSFMKDIHR